MGFGLFVCVGVMGVFVVVVLFEYVIEEIGDVGRFGWSGG